MLVVLCEAACESTTSYVLPRTGQKSRRKSVETPWKRGNSHSNVNYGPRRYRSIEPRSRTFGFSRVSRSAQTEMIVEQRPTVFPFIRRTIVVGLCKLKASDEPRHFAITPSRHDNRFIPLKMTNNAKFGRTSCNFSIAPRSLTDNDVSIENALSDLA